MVSILDIVDTLVSSGISVEDWTSLYYHLLPTGNGNEREITAKWKSLKTNSLHDLLQLMFSDVAVKFALSPNAELTVGYIVDVLHKCKLKNSAETLQEKYAQYSDSIIPSPYSKDIRFEVRPPVPTFTGRKEQLAKLHKVICAKKQSGGFTVISQVTAVSGLGGIGKSELCRQYISKNNYCNVVWINAESKLSIQNTFVRLSDKIGTGSHTNDNDIKPITQIVQEVYQYFSGQPSLFVFDNCDRIDDLVPYIQYNGLSPNQRKPCVLVTSRISLWGDSVSVLNLGCLELDEAMDLICSGLSNENMQINKAHVTLLAEKLQCFPLAIQQAIAFIRHTNLIGINYTILDYIKQFDSLCDKLLNSDLHKGLINTYDKTTYTTWKITIQTIAEQEHGQVAKRILDTMAFLQADNVDRAIFKNIILRLDDQLDEKIDICKSVDLLVKYSMITPEVDQKRLSIHRLVQTVTRVDLKELNESPKLVRTILQVANNQHHILYNDQDQLASIWSHVNDFAAIIGECYFTFRYINGMTPLHLLSEGGHESAIETITSTLSKGWFGFGVGRLAKAINKTDTLNRTPVWLAANFGFASIVKHFINLGALLTIEANVAIKFDLMKIVNHNSVGGVTCLHISSLMGHADCVELILKANPSLVDHETKFGKTCLQLAIDNGKEEVVKVLKPSETIYNLHASLLRHIENNTLNEVEAAIEKQMLISSDNIVNRPVGYYSLYTRALTYGCPVAFLEFLESKGAKFQTFPWESCLQLAAANGRLNTSKYIVNKYNQLPSDPGNDNGWTPLHAACQNGHLPVLKYFIKEIPGMSVNITDFFKKDSLLHSAAFHGQYEIVEYLLDKGANYNAKNIWGISPIISAAISGKFAVVDLFLKKCKNLALSLNDDDKKSDIKLCNELGITLLHFAAAFDNIKLVKELINKYGIYVDIGIGKCVTPLHIAVVFNSPNTVNYLVNQGANVGAKIEISNLFNVLVMCSQNKSIGIPPSLAKVLRICWLRKNLVDYCFTLTPISIVKIDLFANSDILSILTERQNKCYNNFEFSNFLLGKVLSFERVKKQLNVVINFINQRKIKDHFDVVFGQDDVNMMRTFLSI